MPVDVISAEGVGVFSAKQFIQMFASLGQLFVARDIQREVGQVEDAFQLGHLFRINHLGYEVTHKE